MLKRAHNFAVLSFLSAQCNPTNKYLFWWLKFKKNQEIFYGGLSNILSISLFMIGTQSYYWFTQCSMRSPRFFRDTMQSSVKTAGLNITLSGCQLSRGLGWVSPTDGMTHVPWSRLWLLSSTTFKVLRIGYINLWIMPPVRLLNIDVSVGGLTQWCSVTDRYYVIYRKGYDNIWIPYMLNRANITIVIFHQIYFHACFCFQL